MAFAFLTAIVRKCRRCVQYETKIFWQNQTGCGSYVLCIQPAAIYPVKLKILILSPKFPGTQSSDSFHLIRLKQRNKKRTDCGLLTKHSFIVMVETWKADTHGGDRTAVYFAWTAFCAAFMPFLLCFLAKRMFLRNLGSTCSKGGTQTVK